MESRRTPKRKRATSSSVAPSPTQTSSTSFATINPLSHRPNTLKQFVPAGLSPNEPVPTTQYPNFPHKALPRDYGESKDVDSTDPSEYEDEEIEEEAITEDDGGKLKAWRSSKKKGKNLRPRRRRRKIKRSAFSDTEGTGGETSMSEAEIARHRQREKREKRHNALVKEEKIRLTHRKHVGALLAAIHRSLGEGNIARAEQGLQCLTRMDVYGKRVDLRYFRSWELGVEVLLRGGEENTTKKKVSRGGEEDGDDDDKMGEEGVTKEEEEREKEKERARRIRASENLARIRAFYMTLVHQYPWSRTHPNRISAPDFYPALFALEMDGVYSEHVRGLDMLERRRVAGLDEDSEEGEDMDGGGGYDAYGNELQRMDLDHMQDPDHPEGQGDEAGLSREDRRLLRARDRLRQTALARMKGIAERMDGVMENLPFSRDHELLRLRAMVALYIGDLNVPPHHPRRNRLGHDEEGVGREAGEAARERERERAAKILYRIQRDRKGELDAGDRDILDLLDPDGEFDDDGGDEHDEDQDYDDGDGIKKKGGGGGGGLVMYSSLPAQSQSSLPMR